MKPLQERLNERLEQRTARSRDAAGAPAWLLSPVHAPNQDPEADELVALALRLQAAPPLQVDPDFAWQLEQRCAWSGLYAVGRSYACCVRILS